MLLVKRIIVITCVKSYKN